MEFWRWIGHFFAPSPENEHRPHFLRRGWLLFFFALMLATEGFLVADLISRQVSQTFLAAVVPGEILALTNEERAQNGDGTLTENAELDAAAQAKANDMAEKGYFAHVSPTGETPWDFITAAGYQYQYAGENLAVNFVDSQDVMNAWMASPTHRANILKSVYTDIGVGVAQGLYDGQLATFVVQEFASPLESASVALAPAQAPPPPSVRATLPQVAGAATQSAAPAVAVSLPAPASGGVSFADSLSRGLMRALSNPESTVNTVLVALLALLAVALLLAFFMHLQVQHPRMLASGAFLAMMAFVFLLINLHLNGGVPQNALEAAVGGAPHGVVIDPEAATTGFALFPPAP